MKSYLSIVFIFFIIISPYTLVETQSQQINPTIVDFIYANSKIISLDDSSSIYEAIAIKDGIIVALGSNEDILTNYDVLNNQCYNLEGRTIMPGIIDGHTHYMASQFWIGATDNISEAQDRALSYGYTTLNEKSVDGGELAWFQEGENNNNLRLRINCFLIYNYAWLEDNHSVLVENWPPDIEPVSDHDLKLRIPGFKIYEDGASGNRGVPAMSIPYTPEMMAEWGISSLYGDLYFNQSELNIIVDSLQDRGFIVAFHSMGDRSTETVLNAIEHALNGSTNDNYRHQIEHNSFIRPDLIAQAQNLHTIHSVRGYFPTYWQEEYEALYNETWKDWYMNRYSLPSVVHSYLETDFSYLHGFDENDWSRSTNIRPFLHLWGLVTRKAIDVNGTIHTPHPWVANHTITVEQALRMMTIEGAYAVKQEDYIGSLEAGKYADLIVLTDDPLTINPDNLKNIQVMLTMIGGNVEFKVGGSSFPLPYYPITTPADTEPTSWILIFSLIGLTSFVLIRRFRN